MDAKGLFNLASALTRVEERLRILIKGVSKYHHHNLPKIQREQSHIQTITVPSYDTWIVTMWHLGRDSKTEFSGERFSFNTIDALDVLVRDYTKEMVRSEYDSKNRNILTRRSQRP